MADPARPVSGNTIPSTWGQWVHDSMSLLRKGGTMLVARQDSDVPVGADGGYVLVPCSTVEYQHPSGTFSAGIWVAPIAGRVRVTAAAYCVYGSQPGWDDRTGSPSFLTIGVGGVNHRLDQLSVSHSGVILGGSRIVSVSAGTNIASYVSMYASGINKTVTTSDRSTFLSIEYVHDYEV